jgi:O-antigen/teichoic acid export membrane protein
MPNRALLRALNRDLIRLSVALILTVVAISCIFIIVVTTVTDNNPKNDEHIILIFLLVGVTIATMHMCLPHGTRTNRYY